MRDLKFMLLVGAVAAQSEEAIVDNLSQAIEKHKIVDTEETRNRLAMEALCFLLKIKVKDQNPVEAMMELDKDLSGIVNLNEQKSTN